MNDDVCVVLHTDSEPSSGSDSRFFVQLGEVISRTSRE